MNVVVTLICLMAAPFPQELVAFSAYSGNPVFAGAAGQWDAQIRERGWIMVEDGQYRMWYTGYADEDGRRMLGHATSPDGITWTRDARNPIHRDHWVEDMCIVRRDGTYYMFAESENDRAHWFTSADGIAWTREGTMDIRKTNGEPIGDGPYGTPAVFVEDGVWYLLYERNDEAVWLATSTDLKTWTHVQDEPVLVPGPDDYDRGMIAVNQVVKYEGRYYIYYHGLVPNTKPEEWTTNIAVSDDLIHWEKYSENPILAENKSSAVLLPDGVGFRLYTMHPAVCVHFSERAAGAVK